jgi:hypothetical protein
MQERSVCLSAFRETVSLTKSDFRLVQVGSRVAAGTPYGKLPEGPEPSGVPLVRILHSYGDTPPWNRGIGGIGSQGFHTSAQGTRHIKYRGSRAYPYM